MPQDRWILYIPWHFPLDGEPSITSSSTRAEAEFKKQFPIVFAHLHRFKPQLEARDQAETGIRYEWYCLARARPEAEQYFGEPKIVFPDIAARPSFAWDTGGHVIENTAYLIPGHKWLLGVLNSPVSFWFLQQVSNTIRGGFVRFIRQYVEQLPIPNAAPDQTLLIQRLSEILIWLHGPNAPTGNPQCGLIAAYFEQWLNGLVYELYFADELHARQLYLFVETAKLAPPSVSELAKGLNLQAFFGRAYEPSGLLRAQLNSLPSLDVVRLIEGETLIASSETNPTDD